MRTKGGFRSCTAVSRISKTELKSVSSVGLGSIEEIPDTSMSESDK